MRRLIELPRRKKRQGRARKGEGTLKLRGTTYWFRIPNPVKGQPPIEGSCRTSDYEEAIRRKNEAILSARTPLDEMAVRPATVGEMIDEYLEERRADLIQRERDDPDYDSRHAVSTLSTTLSHTKRLLGGLGTDSLTTALTAEYRKRRQEKEGVAFTTVNLELRYLITVLRRAMGTTPPRCSRIPRIHFPSEKTRIRQGFIEREDGYEQIRSALPDSYRALFVCAFHTGARCNELMRLRWSMVNLERRVIILDGKTTKTGVTRTIPVWGDMAEALTRQKQLRDDRFPDCPWVFFYWPNAMTRATPGTRIGRQALHKAWIRATEKAGYPATLFHDLRRSALRYAVQDVGIDSTIVRHMSGHQKADVFDRYNIQNTREMEDLGRKLDLSLRTRGKGKGKKVVPIRKAG